MILTIIQARSTSTRLPGKIYMQIAGKSILQHVWEAAPKPKVIAIPKNDTQLKDYCNEMKFDFTIGPEDDVLTRFQLAASTFPEAEYILRLTADCPMLTLKDTKLFLRRANQFGMFPDMIYTNRPQDMDGYDMELFSSKALRVVCYTDLDAYDREHVTPYMYRYLTVIRLPITTASPWRIPDRKVSVDTPEEFEYVKKLMEAK